MGESMKYLDYTFEFEREPVTSEHIMKAQAIVDSGQVPDYEVLDEAWPGQPDPMGQVVVFTENLPD